MKNTFDQDKPIYIQIREKIEDQILTDQLKVGDQAPSTTQLVNFYKVNHVTVSKGVNQLVDEGILYKKRGIGMFVAEGAKEKLIERRKETFINDYVIDFVQEANKLGFTTGDLIELIKKAERNDTNEN